MSRPGSRPFCRWALEAAGFGLCFSTVLGVHALEPVRLNQARTGFVLASSGQPFRVWGVNYDHDAAAPHGRLLEDYWVEEWDTVGEDFREMRELGANTVRIHLQVGRFLTAPDTPHADALRRLGRLLELAEATGVYLDLTGLGCYHKQEVPAWYDALDESGRWAAQAVFWKAVARVGRKSAAVFCYDLMNEPIIGGDAAEGWLSGELGGKHFVQRLTLDPKGRPAREIAEAWVSRLTAAIREEDPDHLITVGVIPWAMVWPTAKPVFYAPEVARHLSFASVHCYPKVGEVDRALEALRAYDVGMPLVIEEMFPLSCSLEEMDEFVRRTEPIVEGWMSFYWGKTIQAYERSANPTLAEAVTAAWLRRFRDLAPARR